MWPPCLGYPKALELLKVAAGIRGPTAVNLRCSNRQYETIVLSVSILSAFGITSS